MMILITGGCGFIGRHVAEELLKNGYDVRILDALIDQVHADVDVGIPEGAQAVRGDVRDKDAVRAALAGVDGVIHLAAEVGVGQSMYEIARYVGCNDLGTAVLLEAMIDLPIRKLVVASSMSVYGEELEKSWRLTACLRRNNPTVFAVRPGSRLRAYDLGLVQTNPSANLRTADGSFRSSHNGRGFGVVKIVVNACHQEACFCAALIAACETLCGQTERTGGGSRFRLPAGRYAEAPAAALVPPLAWREFPKSRPAAGAMLISPILFIV